MVTLAQWIQGLSVPGSDYAEETTMLGRKFPVGSAVVLIEAFVVPDSTQGGAAESYTGRHIPILIERRAWEQESPDPGLRTS
jgi:hypothetical protein